MLYEVHVELTYYAVADSPAGAEALCSDAFDDLYAPDYASAHEVSSKCPLEWPGDALVYGPDSDTTLDEALAAQGLPSVAEIRQAWVNKTFKSQGKPNG